MNYDTDVPTKADELRATTKWIIAGAVGLASALIAIFPAIMPADRELNLVRSLSAIGLGFGTIACLSMIIASAVRVLGPRPTTLRDLLGLADRNGKKDLMRTTVAAIDSSERELLPPTVVSVRHLWREISRDQISGDESRRYVARVLVYYDELTTAIHFRSLIRAMAIFGSAAVVSTTFLTYILSSAPTREDLSWLDRPILASAFIEFGDLPEGCSQPDWWEGYILATDRSDSRYLFGATPTEECPGFGVILDAQVVVPVVGNNP